MPMNVVVSVDPKTFKQMGSIIQEAKEIPKPLAFLLVSLPFAYVAGKLIKKEKCRA